MIAPTEKEAMFHLVFTRNKGRFYFRARQYASAGEVEDLLQEIKCQIWRSLDGFKGGSDPETWAYRIAQNTAISYERRRIRRDRALRSYRQNVESEQKGGRGEEQILQEFTESLPDRERNIFILYLTKLSYAEIAEFDGISEPALRMKISRIKNQFEQRYL